MKAIYVSVWDGGAEIRTSCEYDPITGQVSNVESADVDGLDLEVLDKEYVELPSGEQIDRENFLLEDEDF